MLRTLACRTATTVSVSGSRRTAVLITNRLISTTERDTKDDNESSNFRFAGGRTKHVNANPAQDLVNQIPPVEVMGRIVSCDGGGGALGHPKIFINLDNPEPQRCTYCGIRYVQKPHH